MWSRSRAGAKQESSSAPPLATFLTTDRSCKSAMSIFSHASSVLVCSLLLSCASGMSGDADFVPDDISQDPLLTDASPTVWPVLDASSVQVPLPASSAEPWGPSAVPPRATIEAGAQTPIVVSELLPVDAARPSSPVDASASLLDAVAAPGKPSSTPTSTMPMSSTPASSTPTSTMPISSTPTSSSPTSSTPTSNTTTSSIPMTDAGGAATGAAAQCQPQSCTNSCGLAARCCNARGQCACMSLLRTCTLPSLRP